MEFSLSDTQLLLKDMTQRFIEENYSFEQRRKVIEGERDRNALWDEYSQLGLLGLEIEEEYGGSGRGYDDLAIVLEAFGSGLVVDPYLSTVVVGGGLISSAGNSKQKAELLPKIVAGHLKVALAYAEPSARYRADATGTTSVRTKQGFLLNGRKSTVIGGDTADLFIVSARVEENVGLFLVPHNAAGVRLISYAMMDDRGAAEIEFDNVAVGPNSVLGPVEQGSDHLAWALDRGVAALCCEAVGVMSSLNELTLDYLRTRSQFGRPIGSFQALQHRMADMLLAAQQARSIALLSTSHANNRDAMIRSKAVSAAKVQVGLSGRTVGSGAIQLHGGIGVTMEYSAGHYFRRLTAIEKMFGDQAFHLARYAGQKN